MQWGMSSGRRQTRLQDAPRRRPLLATRSLLAFVALATYLVLTTFGSSSTKQMLLAYFKEGVTVKDFVSINNVTMERNLENIEDVATTFSSNNGFTSHKLSILEQHAMIKRQALASLNSSHVPAMPEAPLQLLRLPIPLPPLSPKRKRRSLHARSSAAIASDKEQQQRQQFQQRPIMAIITSTTSKGRAHLPIEQSLLVRHLLPSIVRTISMVERQTWRVHVYIALDDTDTYWLQQWRNIHKAVVNKTHMVDQSWFNLTFGVFSTHRPGHIPFNEMALVAYKEGADYYCRVNDDSEFLTAEWITEAVNVLQNHHDPPNFGVVAPSCDDGNWVVMTHDIVHRTHLEIFGGRYYPPVFDNYFLDDWISFQYASHTLGPALNLVHTLNVTIKHWVYQERYTSKGLVAPWLPVEYERGRRLILQYMNPTFPTQAQRIAPTLAGPRYTPDAVVQAVLQALPPNGNMLVWGIDGDSHYWHRATSGTVLFLYEQTFDEFATVFIKPQNYILTHKVEYNKNSVLRGNVQHNYIQFVANQSLTSGGVHTWCNLRIELPDFVLATTWDVIWIHTPKECTTLDHCDNGAMGPGMFQPLYMSHTIVTQQLQRTAAQARANEGAAGAAAAAAPVAHVFVNDYEQPYAQEFAQTLFDTQPARVVRMENGTKQFAQFTLGPDASLVNHNGTVEYCIVPFKRLTSGFVQYAYPSPAAVAQSSLVRSPESWVILLEVNHGYFAFLKIWLHFFAPLNISIPVVIVTEDDQVQAAIHDLLPRRYGGMNVTLKRSVDSVNATSSTSTSSSPHNWGSVGFYTMVGKRPVHIRQLLERGLNVIYTDVDTVWRSNPLPYLVAAAAGNGSEAVDIVASVNSIEYPGFSPYFSTSFMAVQSNARTVELMKQWAALHQPPAAPSANTLTFNMALQQQQNRLGIVSHQPLQWREFPDGQLYFEQYSEEQRNNVVVVHNDFLLGDFQDAYKKKRARFEKHGFWKATPR